MGIDTLYFTILILRPPFNQVFSASVITFNGRHDAFRK